MDAYAFMENIEKYSNTIEFGNRMMSVETTKPIVNLKLKP